MMPPNMDSMSSGSGDMDSGSDDMKMKLLGLTRLLQAIESIAGDDLKPYLDDMIQTSQSKHEDMESPDEESDEQESGQEDDGGPMVGDKKPGIEIGIGMGKPSDDESDEDDEDTKKPKGLLAILATRAKKPRMG